MATSSTTANPGSGGDAFTTDTIAASGAKMMVTKLHSGADTLDGGVIGPANPLNVQTEGGYRTYSAAITGFTPFTAAVDFWRLIAPTSGNAILTRLELVGYATAASAALVIKLIKRSTLGTIGGATFTALTAVPHNSADAAATGSCGTVSVANYTAEGTLQGVVSSKRLVMQAVGAPAAVVTPLIWDFTNRNEKGIQLVGAGTPAEQIALNWNAATVPAGTVLDIVATWLER